MFPAKRLDFIYFDAGGGHKSAALALKSVLESQGRNWQIELVNLQELLDSLDIFRQATGLRLQDIYNLVLAKGWTLGSRYLLPPMHGVIRLFHRAQVEALSRFWENRCPDLVISLVPNFNRAIFQGLKRVSPQTELVTILTDLADYPPHFWMERQTQYFVCGTEKAAQQARAMGHSRNRIFRVSGMILRPSFYETAPVDKTAERKQLGLAPDVPTGLLLFGAQGSPAMRSIVEHVDKANLNVQFIAICGRNAHLKQQIQSLETRRPVHVTGFTPQIAYYMQLADFFVGKPGPGSISEAIHMKLPVLVESNAWTLPQERYNAEWIRDQNVGIVLKSFRDIDSAMKKILAPGALDKMRARACCLENRAVFEIADILENLVERQ